MPHDNPTSSAYPSGPPRICQSRMRMIFARCLTLGLLLASVPFAQAADPITVPRVQGEVKVDGQLDEPLWQQATKFELPYETEPGENTPASVKTTVYIGENGSHLLVAFVAEDPDPTKIRAFLRDRDSAWDDDFVGMNLDTFDDQRRSYEFYVNPLGAQMDVIYEEANGNEDPSWDGLWNAAGHISEHGYVVEIAVPFSTIRFKSGGDVQQWAADFVRFRPREHRYRMSNNIMDRNNRCYLCGVGKLRGFAGVQTGNNLEIAPTVTTRFSQERPGPGASFHSSGLRIDPGVDVKWSPSPNLTLNATVNPDFSQVEADSAQLSVNNTFALFYPEKRPFFLEGADYFTTPNKVVYTRNVTDPDLGLRVTSRNGQQTYGVFIARDTVTNLLIPGLLGSDLQQYDFASTDAALRYRYDFAGNSSVGVIATERRGGDYSNSLQGVDGHWQHGNHSFEGQYLSTRTRDPGQAGIQGDAYTTDYSYHSRDWSFEAGRSHFDDGFRADLGFIGQVGYQHDFGSLQRNWYGDQAAVFKQIHVTANWQSSRALDGTLLEIKREFELGMDGPLQSHIELGHTERDRQWNGLRFPEQFNRFYGDFIPVSGVSIGLFARHGDRTDLANSRLAKFTAIEPNIALNLGRSLTLSVDHNYQKLSRDGGNVYVANLTDLRLSWQFSLRQRLRLAWVRSDIRFDQFLYSHPVPARLRSISSQLIYSYKVNPRTALYAGYADGYFGDESQPLFQADRTLFLKLAYAFER